MAIEKARIAAGPTVERAKARMVCLDLYTGVPSTGTVVRRWDRDTGTWEWFTKPVSNPVGLIGVIDQASNTAELYVGVNGAWTRVSLSTSTIDPATGKPWDPLAHFYTPLAS